MARHGAKTLGVLFIMFLFISSCKCSDNEFELLLSIKSWIQDPLRSLSNWNLSLPYCHWNGVACDNSSHVTKIELSGKNLSGKLEESIFHFPYVETMDLSNNQLSGEIPFINFSSCLSLRFLNLSNNNFTGLLPKGSSSWRLQVLDLSNNMISGKIPEQIGLFSGLEYLDLGGNVLVGGIPKSISNMTGLEILTLASNQLIGEIPHELGLLKNLKLIYLGFNKLSGEIPIEIGELTSLNHLNLVNNNLTGEIPSSLGNLTNLEYLFLYLNNLNGPIPRSIFGLKTLKSLDLSDNSVTGEIPELIIQLQNLEILHLFSNNFTGKIPNALSSLPQLQVLQLWSNKFSGEIPQNLGKQNNLTLLDLSTNNLTGKIPDTLCQSGFLFKLILFSNSLEGEIPNTLSGCKSLKRIRLQNNKLSGELSSDFTKLPFVYFLDLSNNSLSGTISSRRWEMPELQMLNLASNNFLGELPGNFGSDKLENLDLSKNNFSGDIPLSFGNLSELMELKLSENKLSGNIPKELSSCQKIVSLDLSHNQFSGQIPYALSELPVLGQLDLSVNELSGEIPNNLGKSESLVMVNISHNHFHGHLPSTGAFLAINSTAVTGNSLCGGETSTGLPPCKGVKTSVWWVFVTCLVVFLAFIVVASFVIVFMRQRRTVLENKRLENEFGIWELEFFDSKASKEITMDDILSWIGDQNFISSGKTGILYRGKVTKKSAEYMVEVVSSEMINNSASSTGFWNEVGELGKVRHPNIVKLVAMGRSGKGGFLVYECVEGKSLSEVLGSLSWEKRQKIAVGIAKALRYLHCYCSSSVKVGELSPEKIIVDGKEEPRLRLSFPGMVCFMSSAYVAPETKETKDITETSDIYGLGLIFIQLLTGKTPADVEFGLEKSIVEWARDCYSDRHLDTWLDPTVRGQTSNSHNGIVETMNLALHCTAGDPTARPCSSDVVKTLESIIRPSSCVLGIQCSSTI